MTIHEFGDKKNPVIMLFPGTMCYWRGNFGGVIDTLAEAFCREITKGREAVE